MIFNGIKILPVTLFCTLTFTLPAFAENQNKLPRPSVETSGSLVINWNLLNLSNTQQQRMKSLKYDFQKVAIRYKADIELNQIEIEKLLVSPHSNPEAIRKLIKEKSALETKLRMAALDNFLSMKSLLNSDQLARLSRAINLL